MTREQIMQLSTDYLNDCESEHEMNELFYYVLELQKREQESCEDCVNRQAILSMQYRIDDSATLSTRDVVNVDDIENLPPVIPQPKVELSDLSEKVLQEIRQEVTMIPVLETDDHNDHWYRDPQAIIDDVYAIIDNKIKELV